MCPQRHTKFYFPFPISLNFQRNLRKNPWPVEHTKDWFTWSMIRRINAYQGPATNLRASTVTPGVMT